MNFLVTGASSGIGFHTAAALLEQGHTVITVARNVESLLSLQQKHPAKINVVSADLKVESNLTIVTKEVALLDRLNGIVHSAGSLIKPASYETLTKDVLVADMAIHVAAPIALNNTLKEKLSGSRVVYIDSYSATALRVGWAAYSIVKAAAQMAARAASAELVDSRVIRVFPGAVRTQLVNQLLATEVESQAADTYKALDAAGEVIEPDVIGVYIANILTKASDEQLAERETWDFTKAEDRVF